MDRVSPWHDLLLSEVSWPELAAKAGTEGADWAPVLAQLVPSLVALGTIGTGAPAEKPVLSHNSLGPAKVRRGRQGLVVFGWEHAGGQPPSWELGDALVHWTVDPGRGVNVAGARTLVEGYHATAGSLPALGMDMFRGAVTSLANHTAGQIELALTAHDDEERRYANRSVRHLLTHLPTRATLEQLLDAVS
ncbi:hypothetical protein [Actinophytocola sp.]|uniref:hypothetical protein n=1 Tax=Actinophytocola sp. TaxID=1872138 RepID=UPI002ED04943